MTPVAAGALCVGRVKGSPKITVDVDMRDMAKTSAWSVSSYRDGNGIVALRDNNLDTYRQLVTIAHHFCSLLN
jgi:anaphase-promoting complex subunit 10